MVFSKCVALAVLASLSAPLIAGKARADDRPLIWEPSRIGENSVSLKTGVRLPEMLTPTIGVVTQVNATDTGAVTSAPVAVWGSVVLATGSARASSSSKKVDFNVDADSTNVKIRYVEQNGWIENPDLNVVSSRSATYRSKPGTDHKAQATQSIKLEFPSDKVSFGASGTVYAYSGSVGFVKALSMDKQLAPKVDLTASVSQNDTKPAAQLKIGYSTKW